VVLRPVVLLAAQAQVAAAAKPGDRATFDCAGDLEDPVSETPEWEAADLNNQQQCSTDRDRIVHSNPAVQAAIDTNAASGYPGWLATRSGRRIAGWTAGAMS